MPTFDFWCKWLGAVCVHIVIFGAFMALMNTTSLFAPIGEQVDAVF
jgi:hypothetical protein